MADAYPARDLAQAVRDGLAGKVQAAAMRRDDPMVDAARQILEQQGLDTTDAEAVLVDLYGEGYVAATHAAMGQLPAGVEATGPGWEQGIDWSEWAPGNNRAAALLAGNDESRGLKQLLDDAQVTIDGIDDTTLDRLALSLAEGVADGENLDDLAARVAAITDDADRAELIATTETARAVSVATMDSYAENGVAGVAWLTAQDDGVDPDCEDNEAAGPVALGDEFPSGDTEPPAHPGCRCTVVPVMADELEED